jgi:integrase
MRSAFQVLDALPRTDGVGGQAAGQSVGGAAMNTACRVSFLLQRFFTERLMNQRNVSSHTIACYRDTRNLRLTAIRSFFRYVSFQEPTEAARIQRILVIPNKRQPRRLIGFLTYPEVEALLAAPDQRTWCGRRDHTFLLLTVQTGLRLSSKIQPLSQSVRTSVQFPIAEAPD